MIGSVAIVLIRSPRGNTEILPRSSLNDVGMCRTISCFNDDVEHKLDECCCRGALPLLILLHLDLTLLLTDPLFLLRPDLLLRALLWLDLLLLLLRLDPLLLRLDLLLRRLDLLLLLCLDLLLSLALLL